MSNAGTVMHSLRPTRIASTSGHTVVVYPLADKPEGTFVPKVVVPEALARGCAPVEPAALGAPAPAPTEDNSQEQVIAAVEQLIAENNPDNFRADGQPKVAAVKRVVGFDVKATDLAAAVEAVAELQSVAAAELDEE